jgi:hypothetical protein
MTYYDVPFVLLLAYTLFAFFFPRTDVKMVMRMFRPLYIAALKQGGYLELKQGMIQDFRHNGKPGPKTYCLWCFGFFISLVLSKVSFLLFLTHVVVYLCARCNSHDMVVQAVLEFSYVERLVYPNRP